MWKSYRKRGKFKTKSLAVRQYINTTQAPWLSAASENLRDRKKYNTSSIDTVNTSEMSILHKNRHLQHQMICPNLPFLVSSRKNARKTNKNWDSSTQVSPPNLTYNKNIIAKIAPFYAQLPGKVLLSRGFRIAKSPQNCLWQFSATVCILGAV